MTTPKSIFAGTVTLWRHGEGQAGLSEIGWMVLPEFQRQGFRALVPTSGRCEPTSGSSSRDAYSTRGGRPHRV